MAVANPTVEIPPLILNAVPTILLTFILGEPLKPDAVVALVALPVTSPITSP